MAPRYRQVACSGPGSGVCVGDARATSERLTIMTDGRAERIYSVLAAHPDGLPTPRIYDLSGEQIEPRRRALTKYGVLCGALSTGAGCAGSAGRPARGSTDLR